MVGLVGKDSLEKRTFQYCTLSSIINLKGSYIYIYDMEKPSERFGISTAGTRKVWIGILIS